MRLKALCRTTSGELEALIQMAEVARRSGATDVDHMDGAAAAFNYIRMADLVASYIQHCRATLPVLDWGCGYGQVSWLLARRHLPVVSCDVEERPARASVPELSSLKIELIGDPVRLPYDSDSFGSVLSVGVLEHVRDLEGSLREVSRVLRRDGLFFIFMFPNRFSWAESLADLRHISVHPHKYTFRQASRILLEHGFTVEAKWRRNFLPRNLTGSEIRTKQVYGRFYRQIESLDRVLANVPPTCVFSGVLELIARKGGSRHLGGMTGVPAPVEP